MNEGIRTLSPARFWSWMSAFILFTLTCLIIAPLLGAHDINLKNAFDFSVPLSDNTDRQILFLTRYPRVILALIVGASLALSGAALQGLLRNPLASPFTLGVASGGTLGAALAIFLGSSISPIFLHGSTMLRTPWTVLGAFVFSLLTIALVWALAYRKGRLPVGLLLLAGVSVNFLFGALVLLLQYMSDFEQNFALVRWMMGSLDVVNYDSVIWVAPVTIVCGFILMSNARAYNLMALGDSAAQTSGVNVRRLELGGFIASGLLAGAAVSQVGPIGFVGLIVPHLVRIIVGPDYRLVMPGSFIAGGGFLVICDLASRTVMAPIELPPGIITALLGAPFFLSLLRTKAKEIAV